MAIFTAIVTALGIGGTFFGSLVVAGLKMVVGIGLNKIAVKLSGKKAQEPQFSVKGQLQRGADLPQSFLLGKAATAGSLVYANSWGDEGGTPNAYLTMVVALSDLPVRSLDAVWINGEPVTLGGTAHGQFGLPVTEYNKGGKDHAWIKFYDGTQTGADTYLTDRVSSAERPWAAGSVGKGVAYAVATCLVNQELFSGFPAFMFELTGARLYDPSKDSSVGGVGAQRWDNPATWGGDGDFLPAVQLYNLFRGLRYDGRWLYGVQALSAAQLPSAHWITQINKCRSPIAAQDGQEPRFRSGGEIAVGAQIANAMEALLDACQGRVSEAGGVYKLFVGEPDAPVASFTDGDILSSEEQSFTPFFGLADTVNGINAKYPDPAQAWQIETAPPINSSLLEAEDGGRRLMVDIQFDLVPYPEQVQRIMHAALKEARRARRHTFTLPPRFWRLEPGDVVEWTSARNGYLSKLFRVDGVIDLANADVVVDLTEIDPSDYDFDTEVDFTPVGGGSIIRPVYPPQVISGWSAVAASVPNAEGLGVLPAIQIFWDGTVDDVAGVHVRARVKATGAMIFSGRFDDVTAGTALVVQGILANTEYEVQGRYIPRSPRDVAWSDWLTVLTPNLRITPDLLDDAVWDAIEEAATADVEAIVNVALAPTEASILTAMEGLELRSLDQLQGDLIAHQVGQQARRELAYVAQDVRAEISADRVASAAISTALGARIDDAEATLLDEIEVRASETEALSLAITATQAQLTDAEGELDAAATAIDAVTARVTQTEDDIEAVSQAVSSTQAALDDAEDDIAAQASTLSQHTSRLNTAEGQISAQAQSLNSVSTTVGQHTAAIDEVATSIDGLHAEYVLRVAAGDVVGGMIIGANAGDSGAPTVNVTFAATAFRIAAPGGAQAAAPFAVYTSQRTIDGINFPAGVYMENAYIGRAMIGRGQITDTVQSDNYAESGGVPTAGLKLDFKNGRIFGAGSFISRPLKVASGSFQLTGTFGDGHVFRRVNTGIRLDNSASWGLLEAPIVAFASFGSGATAPGGFNADEAYAHLAAKVKWGWRWNGFPGGAQPSDVQTRDPSTLVTAPWSGGGNQRVMLDIELETTQGVYFVNPTINWVVFQVT